MSEIILLVDFENIGKIDLTAVPQGVKVALFFGAAQKTVPREFMEAALKLRERFEHVNAGGQGKNALDFHIAYYLGEYLTKSPRTECIILSRDKDFAPLVKHLVVRGFSVRTANTLRDAFPPRPAQEARRSAPAREPGAAQEDALEWLAGSAKNRRPRTRKALAAHLYSHFSKKRSEADIQATIDRLLASGQLTEANGRITYHF
ncbi:MAG: NYN domain-containing protein [Proteobacteria bacterium]|nr:NYN domain-containing protein [Pseudomonadota bacterium]